MRAPQAAQRSSERHRYRLKGLVVHIRHPGAASATPYLVPTRNISRGGVSLLHGGFVHIGTRCLAQLITVRGSWHNIVATVVRCRYIERGIHEVSLQFDEEVDPADFCTEGARRRVLLVEGDPSMARVAAFFLAQLNAEMDHADDGQAGLKMAIENSYDLILLDMEMPVLDGFGMVAQLRSRGYTGFVVAATVLTGAADRERCLRAGCDRHLPKPYTRDGLSDLLRSLWEEPLVSDFHDDPAKQEFIRKFVAELPAKTEALEEAVAANDADRAGDLVRSLKVGGDSCGFGPITEAAAEVEAALLGGAAEEEVREGAGKLAKVCLQACAAPKAN